MKAVGQAPVQWKARTLVVVRELVCLASSLLAGALIVVLAMMIGVLPDPQVEIWSAFIAGPLLMGVAAGTYAWLERRGLPTLRGTRGGETARGVRPLLPAAERPSGKSAATMTALAVGLALLGSALIALLLDAVGWEVEEQEAVLRIVRGGWSFELVALILAAVLLAPIGEEALFRGHFFRRIHQHAGPWPAYVASALTFAFVHDNLSGLLTYAWLAVCFAYVYRRTGRLWTAMFVHLGNNVATLAFLLLLPE